MKLADVDYLKYRLMILSEQIEDTDGSNDEYIKCIEQVFEIIDSLHTVSIEAMRPLTDKEQRIFLAAMGREEEVCKQVDEKYGDCREAYEDSLVRTCREIIRKVKGVLWPNMLT